MKIKNQFIISVVIFIILLLIIISSVIVTNWQVDQINIQADISRSIERGAEDLNYLSNDYLLFRESQQRERWETKFSSLSSAISDFNPSDLEEQKLVNNIILNLQRLQEVFDSVVTTFEGLPPNQLSLETQAAVETAYSRMTIQNQGMGFDAELLSQKLLDQTNQLKQTNLNLILIFLGSFSSYIVINYLIIYRHALKSMNNLQDGIEIIGSGNLDYSLEVDKDEVGEISRSFNQMASNLKSVTASKVDLEKEIMERKKAEEALLQAQENLEDYAQNLEKLVEERTEQLKDSERLAVIGETAGMIGHDIRNPLQSMDGALYLAREYVDSIPEGEEKKELNEIHELLRKQVEYIDHMVADLQNFAKRATPKFREIDLSEIVTESLGMVKVPENVDVNIVLPEESLKLVADPVDLKRVLSNLFRNGVQAMPDGGELTIHAYRDKGNAWIRIEDTGVGIPEEIKPRIFTPLFTTKSKGQGFGLAVCKKLIEAQNGNITFQSEEGKGTIFTIKLPIKNGAEYFWSKKASS